MQILWFLATVLVVLKAAVEKLIITMDVHFK